MSNIYGYCRFPSVENVLCCGCKTLRSCLGAPRGKTWPFSTLNLMAQHRHITDSMRYIRAAELGVRSSCCKSGLTQCSVQKAHKYLFNRRLYPRRLSFAYSHHLGYCSVVESSKTYRFQWQLSKFHSFQYPRTLFSSSSSNSDTKTKQEKEYTEEDVVKDSPENVSGKVADQEKSASASQAEEQDKKSSSKLKQFMTNFMTGLRQLWKDIKLAVHINKKLRDYDYDASRLTREELIHLRQGHIDAMVNYMHMWCKAMTSLKTKKDVIKTAPVTVFFFVPFIGYLAPVLAYLWPKRLLSRQFWHPEQKQQFRLEDHAKRSQYYLPLIREVGWACKESKDPELLKVVMDAIDGYHIKNECLLQQIENFEADEAISLQNMPRYHLVKLCKTWMIPAKWYMPRKLLVEGLTWRVKNILTDDDAIRRDGLAAMTSAAVEQACHHRGLEEVLYTSEALRGWMEEWLDLTQTVVPGNHISFVAHCAVFKSLNYRKQEIESQEADKETEQKSIAADQV